MGSVRYVEHKQFRENIHKMTKAGGSTQKAADTIRELFGRIALGEVNPFKSFQTTNHGETRISKCIKYDLPGRCRLITVQDDNFVFLLFAGNHEDSDKWLDRHKDLKVCIDNHDHVDIVPNSASIEDRITYNVKHPFNNGYLYELIQPDELFDRITDSLTRNMCRSIESISSAHSEQEIYAIASTIPDQPLATTLYDAFILLRSDKLKDAHNRIKLHLGDIKTLDELPQSEVAQVKFGDTLIEFRPDDSEFLARADQLMKGGDYKSWMLFMHPAQEKIATANLNGPGKLVGVSGSGKTCVVVRRAVWLASQYSGEKILVLTLNRPLAVLIENLVRSVAPAEISRHIVVKPFFTLCQELLHRFEPHNDKIYDDRTWKSEEHIDEIWTEFYRCEVNNKDAAILLPIHISLIQRGINSEHYLREEFDWIRTAFPRDRREEYLKIDREGRVIPFDAENRQKILTALSHWEKKMRDIGVCDYLGLATELYKHKASIAPEYRSIIVDECQDFGTVELDLVRSLVPADINDLLLCGDPAQRVQTKRQSLRLAGIETHASRTLTLRKNYRNTKDILKAAFAVLNRHLHIEHISSEDFEFLDPQLADRSGTTPMILSASSLQEELGYALEYSQEITNEHPETKACIAYCGYSNYEIGNLAKDLDIPLLDGGVDIESGRIFLSDLEQTKGFEFDYMIILNCRAGVLPDQTGPKEEQFRDVSKFYVAMTRTKDQLILSYSGEKSELLRNEQEDFLEDEWSTWLDSVDDIVLLKPRALELLRNEGVQSSLELCGKKFIYHTDAIGLSARTIEVLTRLVDGTGLRDSKGSKKWRTVGALLLDLESHPRIKNLLGPIAYEEIRRSKYAQPVFRIT